MSGICPTRWVKSMCFGAVACLVLVAPAPCKWNNQIPLWPLAAPLAKGAGPDVDNPAIVLYLPSSHRPTPGVVVCPSGNYMTLSLDRDGRQVAEVVEQSGHCRVCSEVSPWPLAYAIPCRFSTRNARCATFVSAPRFITSSRTRSASWAFPRRPSGGAGGDALRRGQSLTGPPVAGV